MICAGPVSPETQAFQIERATMRKFGERILDYFKRADKVLWVIITAISVYALILLRTVPSTGSRSYFTTQLLAILIGYAAAFLLTGFDYRDLSSLWWLAAGVSVALLIYTHFRGIGIQSSGGMDTRAWIQIPGLGLTFQTSELVKIVFMVTFAKHISTIKEKGLLNRPLHVILLGLHALFPVGWMVLVQKDMGSAVVFFFMFLAMSFAAGVQLRWFAAVAAMLAVVLPAAWEFGVIQDYQKTRLTSFLHLEDDPTGTGWQQIQGRISIGSGQLFGRGLGTAPRVQKGVVSVQESDYIFSVAAESLGFVGCCLVIALLLALMLRTLYVARNATDTLGTAICMGFFGMVAIQTITNLGMCLNLLPVMGVTLPFFSAGGSSSACLYLGFGLVESVAMHRISADHVRVRL